MPLRREHCRWVPLAITLVGLISGPGLAAAHDSATQATATPPADLLAPLAWLAGCWEHAAGDRSLEEHWLPPRGATMLGVARTVSGNRTVAHEFMSIRERDGEVVYIAAPSGQAETTFVAVVIGDDHAVFENPAHDFPQRIIYRREPDGGLWARIEGVRDGVERARDFRLARVACPDP